MESGVQITWQILSFVDAFAKLRKETINYFMSVRPLTWNNSAPTGLIFMIPDISEVFKNLSRKFKFNQNRTRKKGYFTLRPIYIFLIISRSFLPRMRNVADKSCRENTQFVFSNFFFCQSCLLWESVEKCCTAQRGRPQMTIWQRIVCITRTVEHNYILLSSTVGIKLHVSALYVGHLQVEI